jgi:hypothetical protein
LSTIQNVPNNEAVKPPATGYCQLLVSMYIVGFVVHTVAASFHAQRALRSPML